MDKVIHRNSKVFVIMRDLLISYIVTAFMILILAFLMLKLDVSNMVQSGGIILTYILSSFVGGFLLGKSAEQKRFLWGLGMGALYYIVLLLLSIMIDSVAGIGSSRMFSVMIICLFSGMLGGMVS